MCMELTFHPSNFTQIIKNQQERLLVQIPFSNIKEWRCARHLHVGQLRTQSPDIRVLPDAQPDHVVEHDIGNFVERLLPIFKIDLAVCWVNSASKRSSHKRCQLPPSGFSSLGISLQYQ